MPDTHTINQLMRAAIEEAKKSQSEDAGPHPKVGAVLADREGNIVQRAHRGEESKCHAEYVCLKKAKDAGQDLSKCTLYATLEPCTARGPGKKACARHIIESKIEKIYIGMLDPNPAICGRGESILRFYTVVERFPAELIKEIQEYDHEFIDRFKDDHLSNQSLYVSVQIHEIMRESLERAGVPISTALPIDVDLTIDDISQVCETVCNSAGKTGIDIHALVSEARSEAFDKKYWDRTYDDDGRGLGDHWKNSVISILTDMGAPDFPRKDVIVVGIGNGLEGKELYTTCESLVVVDIGKKSLDQAATILPSSRILKAPAEDLREIPSSSQDIYISLRTYQSTYFDRDSAIREAYRVVRQGGIVLISVANGFLEQGSLIPGLLIPGTAVVDRNLGFRIANQIRARLSVLKFEEIGICTSLDEIYVYGRRGR